MQARRRDPRPVVCVLVGGAGREALLGLEDSLGLESVDRHPESGSVLTWFV
jgi:hypothetical protein